MYDFSDGVQLSITYELSRDLMTISRKVYGFLDFLGDLGGLAGTLYTSFGAVIIVAQYKAVISNVSNGIFLIIEGDEKEKNFRKSYEPNTLKRIPIGFLSSVKLSFQRLGLVAGCNKCCNKFQSRRDKLSHLADKLATDELKLIRWLQFMRSTNLAMTKLFTVE